MHEQSWVTLATSDAEAWQALVLAKSLRRSFTARKLTVLVTNGVSPQMKVFLQNEFDLVHRLETSDIELRCGVANKELAKLWAWTLRSFDKCVFLESSSIVLQNSDVLFENEEFSAFPRQLQDKSGFSASVFVFRPSSETFQKLIKTIRENKTGSTEFILNACFDKWAESLRNHLDPVFNASIENLEMANGSILPKIVRLNTLPWEARSVSEISRNDAETIYAKWLNIFIHEIFPEVNKEENASLREFLMTSIKANNLPVKPEAANNSTDDCNLGDLKDAIAVVGMSCRFPGANTPDEFWNLLAAGADPIRAFPSDRPHTHTRRAENYFEAGFLKCPVDEFDAKFFGISPREAPFVDPQQRILLEVIWESLENANINPQSLKESNTGVFMGIWQQDYDRFLPDYGLSANDFHHRYLGNAFSATASRISYFLGLYGPNFSIESGCSSSSSGVHLACNSLRRGDTNLAISSGVNLVLHVVNPLAGDDKEAVVLSKDYRCKTFDESADGFVRAEGCGAVVLKRYADARRDGDNILALIRGTSLNNDGPGTSFGTPNANAQERVFREALKDARVKPAEVSYVEAHGTGTVVGDPTEMYAIGKVYSEGRKDTLLVSSVKTNIGHAEACAGMAGLIKVILCLKNNAIPPHLHLKNMNPRINLDIIPAKVPLQLTEWTGENRIAAVSSFSMSGTNVHMLVQDPPKLKNANTQEKDTPQVIGISAKSEEALEILREKYMEYLEANPEMSLNDIAYSTNMGRANLPHRISVVANDRSNLMTKLKARSFTSGRIPQQKQKLGFLFTGQGSQYFGMAENLYQTFPSFRNALERCQQLFEAHLGKSLKEVLWTNPALLEQTIYCQPAIFCIQYSLIQLWKYFEITPDYVLGHSVGEFAASVCAGVISVEDAMKLVVERSRFVNQLESGNMMAVKTSQDTVETFIKKFMAIHKNLWIDIAAVNSAEEVVVSGKVESITKFGEFCLNNGVKSQTIPASHAFHSRDMDSVLEEFGKVAKQIVINKPNCVYISGTLAKVMEAEEFEAHYWQRHLRDTVRFSEAIKLMWTDCKILLEIGAQPILLGLAMGNVGDTSAGYFCPSLRKSEEDCTAILTTLSKLYVAGIEINWSRWFGQRRKRAILPTYPFQRQKYWFVHEDAEFDEMRLSTKLLHPLLGRQMPSPLSDTIFCNTLKLKEIPYVEDHKVADRIIVPGAAYLECIMAAGREVLQGGGVQIPLTVEGLTVEAALEMGKPCNVQTVVAAAHNDEGISYKISIHRQVASDQADKWKRHSEAMFSPTTKIPDVQDINIDELKSKLTLKDGIDKAYAKIAEIGIQFGPKFQSIVSAWSGTNEVLTEILLPEDFEHYICHPIVLDAMIQTFAFRFALTSATTETDLQLPIGIKKFVWLSKTSTKKMYAHTSWAKGDGNVNLYSETGEQLAIMEGLELLKTSVDSFLRALNAEGLDLPSLYEEVWRPTMSATRSRIETREIQNATIASPHVSETLATISEYYEANHLDWNKADSMFLLFLLRGIQECEWFWPGVDGEITPDQWKSSLPAHLATDKFVASICAVLEYEGYIIRASDGKAEKVIKNLPSISECEAKIKTLGNTIAENQGSEEIVLRYTKRCGQHFTSVLQGKMSPLTYMFPEDNNEVAAFRFYNESALYNHISNLSVSMLLDTVAPFVGKRNTVLRILEVGAGSGKSTAQILEKLSELGIAVEYTFTDISTMFVAEAKKKFDKRVSFGVLNIEEDPLEQGFAPNQYDIVIAMQVIHATADIKKALINVRSLLKPDGAILLSEQFHPTYQIQLSFGMLDGWWRFEDFRELSPLVDAKTWEKCLQDSGYSDTNSVEMYRGATGGVIGRNSGEPIPRLVEQPRKHWLLIGDNNDLRHSLSRKLTDSNRTYTTVDLTGSEFNKIDEVTINLNPAKLEDFTTLFESLAEIPVEGIVFLWNEVNGDKTADQVQPIYCQALLNFSKSFMNQPTLIKNKAKIIIVTRGLSYIGDAQAGNPNGATGWGLLKSFANEIPEVPITLLDTDQDVVDFENEVEEIYAALWPREREMFIAFREGRRFVQRTVNAEKRIVPLVLPNSDRFRLINPPSHAFTDITIAAATKMEVTGDKVEIGIKACALNFRDLFMILQPEGFEIPDYMSREVGLDIAGVVTAVGPDVTRHKVGDEVIGFTIGGGLASHVVVTERALMKKPKNMTFTSAATIPCAFLTVYYSFVHLAKLNASDRVLIHVATGGVGLAAIQIANHVGAEIYATAGSKKKRAYLRNLGIKNVYHSRNTDYGEGIAKDSNGKGVTVVLNSLTGPNFKETSLNACAPGARFVEIGKINIWKEEEVAALRPDVEYFIVDLAITSYKAPAELEDKMRNMDDNFQDGLYQGLPHDIFPLDLVREAFHHFQEAKHIGKIVVTIPEPKFSPEGKFRLQHNLFNKESTYLITGGLGGIGMEVAKWMTKVGGQNIVLVGRNSPKPKAQELIEKLNADGFNIRVIQADVGNLEECTRIFDVIKSMDIPPLRGIMHAAGVISDAIIPNQDWTKYTEALSPKVYGGWNLHCLTKDYDLEFFVMFSSVAAIVGMPGQSNHSSANRYLDSLAHYRLSLGLPAQSINFGAWSDVGAAAHMRIGTEGALGIKAFTPNRGVLAIEKVMRERNSQIAIIDVADWGILKQFIKLGNYFNEITTDDAKTNKISDEQAKLIEGIKAALPEERQEKIQSFLELVLKQTLRLPDTEKIDPDQNFSELGVDSLMAMEMRNVLQGVLGDKTLSVSALQENRTTRSLSTHIANIMNEDAPEVVPINVLLETDSVLLEAITAADIGPCKPSEFKEVLLTGATGHLGIHFIPELINANLVVHCLVRGKSAEEGQQRLASALKKYGFSEYADSELVKVVLGDVRKTNFGIEEDSYRQLSSSVDAIIHCAIRSNHLENYADGGEQSMRNHNVFGMVNVLKFAGEIKTKRLLFASSMLAVTQADEAGNLSEEYPEVSNTGLDITNGYMLTKFISEKLARQAELRGIPVTVIRYASIFGHSETGYMPPGYNHAWNIMLSCIRIRKFPSFDQNGVPIMPVDIAARISTELFLNDSSETGVYNLTNNSVATEDDIKAAFQGFGVDGEFVPFPEWRDLVFEDSNMNALGPLEFLYGDEGDAPRYFSFHPLASKVSQFRINNLSEKLKKNLPSVEASVIPAKTLLERYLDHHFRTVTGAK